MSTTVTYYYHSCIVGLSSNALNW